MSLKSERKMRGKKNTLGVSFPLKEEGDGEKCMRQIRANRWHQWIRQLCVLASVADQVGIGKKSRRLTVLQEHIFVLKTD